MAPRAGFARSGCPVPGCANPYLSWHYLGPDEKIILCLAHAEQAARTAVPAERLRALALAADQPAHPASTRPVWQQRKILARVCGNFFYETPIILRLGTVTSIGFNRDEEDSVLLDLRMPTVSGEPRAVITGSFLEVPPAGAEVVCPPSGRLIDIAYPNGDHFRAEFTDVHTARALQVRFGTVARWAYRVQFPVTLATIALTVADTDLEFGPDRTEMGGAPTTDCFTSHGDAAIDVRMTAHQLDGLFPGGAS